MRGIRLPRISARRAQAIEAARLKLAEIVLAVAKNGNHDPQQLTEQAVKLMFANQSSAIRKI